jgi:hypothetical protein
VLGAQRAYVAGKREQFVNLMKTSPDADDRIIAHLTAGDVAAAETDLAQIEPSGTTHLLMFLAASLHNRPELATKHFDAAAKLLSEGDAEDRTFAAALQASPGTTKPADLLRLRKEPDKKAILLAALGVRDPSSRGAYFELARKLNYDRRFPHLLLNQVFDAPPTPATRASR